MTLKVMDADRLLVEMVLKSYKILEKENDLSPANELINRTLGQLVDQTNKHHSYLSGCDIYYDPQIEAIQEDLYSFLSLAEGEMESYVVNEWLAMKSLHLTDLSSFRYWTHYHHLVQAEVRLVQSHLSSHQPIAFVGSGSFPLTALLFWLWTGQEVVCIDTDKQAIQQSSALAKRVEASGLRFLHSDGAVINYQSFQGVFVASLVDNKEDVVKRIGQTQPSAWLAIRTVEGIYRLLYRPVETKMMKDNQWTLVGKTQATQQMINTTHLYKRT